MPRIHGLYENLLYQRVYDSFTTDEYLRENSNSFRLFGHKNIGDLSKTNLQSPGNIAETYAANLTGWWLTAEGNSEAVKTLLTDGFAVLNVGESPIATLPLHCLWNKTCELNRTIPVRQNFHVEVSLDGQRVYDYICTNSTTQVIIIVLEYSTKREVM